MKINKGIKFLLSAAVAIMIALIGMRLSTGVAWAQVKGEIDRVWVDHNVYEDGKKGMRIHVKFAARNMRGAKGRMTGYFYFQDGTALKDANGRYKTKEGKVSVGRDFTPRYANSVYNDFTLFMPYEELHLTPDRTHGLKFNVVAYHPLSEGYTEFARSNGYTFTYGNVTTSNALIRSAANPAKCLHKKEGNWNNGNPIHLWDCNAGTKDFKTWIFDAETGYIRSAANPNKCIHKDHSGWNNGNPIHLWDCNAGTKDFKTWIFDAETGYIRSAANPNKCIHKDHSGWNNGNPIHLWDCDAGTKDFKTWRFDG